jgi:hypothetical protein
VIRLAEQVGPDGLLLPSLGGGGLRIAEHGVDPVDVAPAGARPPGSIHLSLTVFQANGRGLLDEHALPARELHIERCWRRRSVAPRDPHLELSHGLDASGKCRDSEKTL